MWDYGVFCNQRKTKLTTSIYVISNTLELFFEKLKSVVLKKINKSERISSNELQKSAVLARTDYFSINHS